MTITLLRSKENSNIRFISGRMFGWPVERNRGKLGRLRLLSPNEKQADVARHPVGKVKNARRKMKTLWLQIVAPAQENLRRLATQRGWPIRIGRIDSTAPVAAELAREAQKHEFLQPLLGRSTRSVNEIAPAILRYMLADQVRRLVLSRLLCAVTLVLAAARFPVLEVRRKAAEIRGRGGRILGVGRRRGGMRIGLVAGERETHQRVSQSARDGSLLGLAVVAVRFIR